MTIVDEHASDSAMVGWGSWNRLVGMSTNLWGSGISRTFGSSAERTNHCACEPSIRLLYMLPRRVGDQPTQSDEELNLRKALAFQDYFILQKKN